MHLLASYLLPMLLAILQPQQPQSRQHPEEISDASFPPVVTISFGSNRNREYSRAVLNAGGAVWALTDHVTDEAEAELIISESDALIIPGSSTMGGVRGRSEEMLIRAALRSHVPILGICNGEQMLNIMQGGTIKRISDRWPEAVATHHEKISGPGQHITIREGSLLCSIFGTTSLYVNSHHKWAVGSLGRGLEIVARGDDGIVEAVEGERMLGLQFHPEIFACKGDKEFLKPFLWLVEQASHRKQERVRTNKSIIQ